MQLKHLILVWCTKHLIRSLQNFLYFVFRRYLYFAQRADVEGYSDVASVFRSTAEGETGHAHGHLEFLQEVSIALHIILFILTWTLHVFVIICVTS